MKRFLCFLLTLIVLLVSSWVLSDDALPHNFNCIKKIKDWDQVKGKWKIDNEELRIEPAQFDKIAILSTQTLDLPTWYSIKAKARGFESAQEQWFGLIVGYKDDNNYWLCSVEQKSKEQVIVKLSQIVKSKRKFTVSVPVKSKAQDTFTFSANVCHGDNASDIRLAINGHREIAYACTDTFPRKVGVSLKSANIAITQYTISGIATK